MAASSVVTKGIPPYAIVGGVPAKIIKIKNCKKRQYVMSRKLPISVNICTYNEGQDIADCLDRIFANNPAEVIVIDDIAAVVAVHSYGRMCKIEQLESICKRKGMYLIEDFSVA